MPTAVLARDEVVGRLFGVFRHSGYDGASLSALSKATGLGKSSLYHHFPDGKDDMVRAVLDALAAQLRTTLFEPLRGAGTPKKRLDAMVRSLDDFYCQGEQPCVLAQLALGRTSERFRAPIVAIFNEWIEAIASVLVDAGLPRAKARARAEDAVLRFEGALLLAAAMADVAVFERTLRSLVPTLLADT